MKNHIVSLSMFSPSRKKKRPFPTGVAKTIYMMRRRLDRSSFEFSSLVGFDVRQIESGPATLATAERLITLLRFAVSDEERSPLLSALAERGIQPSDLSASLLGEAAHVAERQQEGVHV